MLSENLGEHFFYHSFCCTAGNSIKSLPHTLIPFMTTPFKEISNVLPL